MTGIEALKHILEGGEALDVVTGRRVQLSNDEFISFSWANRRIPGLFHWTPTRLKSDHWHSYPPPAEKKVQPEKVCGTCGGYSKFSGACTLEGSPRFNRIIKEVAREECDHWYPKPQEDRRCGTCGKWIETREKCSEIAPSITRHANCGTNCQKWVPIGPPTPPEPSQFWIVWTLGCGGTVISRHATHAQAYAAAEALALEHPGRGFHVAAAKKRCVAEEVPVEPDWEKVVNDILSRFADGHVCLLNQREILECLPQKTERKVVWKKLKERVL